MPGAIIVPVASPIQPSPIETCPFMPKRLSISLASPTTPTKRAKIEPPPPPPQQEQQEPNTIVQLIEECASGPAVTDSDVALANLPQEPQPEADTVVTVSDPHCFIAPTNDCSRAPCPALNALANHGYLPRSGRQITFMGIQKALREAFGLSRTFALFMAIGSFTLLRRCYTHPFDLHDTAIHNLIEHDASLVHDDANPVLDTDCEGVEYAPIQVDRALLRRFLSVASPMHPGASENVFTTMDIAQYRVQRETETKIPLDALHAELGRAEFAMIIKIFGKEQDDGSGKWCVDQKVVGDFFRDQRFPIGWKPTRVLHLSEAIKCSGEIRHEMKEIRKAMADDNHSEKMDAEWYCKASQWFSDVLNGKAECFCEGPHTS